MSNTTTINASITVQDTAVNPAVTVASNSVADQQTGLHEYDALSFVLPPAILFGAPVTVSLGVFKPKSVFISSNRKFQMKIGAGADIHKVNSMMSVTFSGSEPTSLVFATGTGVTLDTDIKIVLGSVHP
jgi:hypothetical protein